MSRLEPKPRSDAAQHLMKVACRLFAARGVDGVTVREIAEAAGQKNHAAVGYHFGSKENLVRELVTDGAKLIDARRNRMLDEMEAAGRPLEIADIVRALIYPSVGMAGARMEDEDSYTRFIVMLSMTHRDLFMDALENRWNSGYQRCLELLRSLMPDMPPAAKNQRFIFLGAYLGAVLAIREEALANERRPHPAWATPQTLDHLCATVTALLQAPYEFDGPGAPEGSTLVLGPLGLVTG